ncbi:MAG: FG-GAP and VCBS repeat-containing protein [Candidatus Sumerlaeia bacterium]|nr:FG-GAP and VCBS repeat-containing protein [Candidatus Sumerlaeia bacterium]
MISIKYITFFILMFAISNFAGAVVQQIDSSQRTLEIRGATANDHLGRPLICTDINGDGYDDIFVGADRWSFTPPQRPMIYGFRGKPRYLIQPVIDLATATPDLIIYGDSNSDNLATALAAGDVNGDGIMDLIAADSTITVAGRVGAGAVYVIFGSTNFFNRTTIDLAANEWNVKILGAAAGDDTGGYNAFGGLISQGLATGDINNDGIADIAIGAHLATANAKTDAGKVFLIWGRHNFSPSIIDLASQYNTVILGNETYGELGTCISIGDLNNDHIDDLILGMEYGSKGTLTSEGKVFVFWGKSNFPATINLLTQNPDLLIRGAKVWDTLGRATALVEVNGDNKLDLIVTAPGWDHAGSSSIDEGAIYGFYGKNSFPSLIDLAIHNADFFIEGYNVSNNIGDTLQGGDFNGDGTGDFIFSSRDGERPGYDAEGRTFGLFGRASFPTRISVQNEEVDFIINGGISYFQLGDTISSGDIDGDGADEILVAAPFYDAGKGRLLIFDFNPPSAIKQRWQVYE